MFCGLWSKSSSLVHLTVKMVFSRILPLFFLTYLIIYYLYIYEEVNIYEQYADSMRQFALYIVNK